MRSSSGKLSRISRTEQVPNFQHCSRIRASAFDRRGLFIASYVSRRFYYKSRNCGQRILFRWFPAESRWSLIGSAECTLDAEQVDRERCEPVLPHVIAGCDVLEALTRVYIAGRDQRFAQRVFRWQRVGDRAQTPRPRQVQAVEVRELGIAAIRDEGRFL